MKKNTKPKAKAKKPSKYVLTRVDHSCGKISVLGIFDAKQDAEAKMRTDMKRYAKKVGESISDPEVTYYDDVNDQWLIDPYKGDPCVWGVIEAEV